MRPARTARSSFDIKEVLYFAYEALTDRKFRTGVTVMMVVVGATMVTSLNGMSQGMNGWINQQLSTIAPNVVIVLPAPRPFAGIGGGGGPSTPPTMIFTEQTASTLRRFLGVQMVFPFMRGTVNINSMGFSTQQTLLATDLQKLLYVNPTLSAGEGRLISKDDSVGIVFGYKVAHPPGQTTPFVILGQMVTLEYTYVDSSGPTPKTLTVKRSFQVKGILNELGTEFRDNVVYTSVPAANSFMVKGGKYDGFYMVTTSAEENDRIQKAILDFFGNNNIGVISPKSIVQTVTSIISGFGMFMTTVGLISLLVGAVGIVTTQFTSVMERVREIGILKAIGFDNRLVLTTFLTESAAIGMIGATLGITIGSLAADLVVKNLPIKGVFFLRATRPVLTFEDLAFTWILAVLLSVLAGLYPAWKASRMVPVDALRTE